MSDQSTFDLQAMTEMAARNPMSLQRQAVDYVQSKLSGDTIPDPLSPLVQVLEVGSTQTAVAINEAFALDRRRYAVLANTQEDLYCVMSDTDYLGRFSSPAQMPIYIMMPYDQLLAAMVTEQSTGIRRLVIPRYTVLRVRNSYEFTLLYPIEIRLLTSGELQVVYNVDNPTPLQPLTTNLLEHEMTSPDGTPALRIEVPVMIQLTRTTITQSVNDGAVLNWILPFDNKYYYARVWSIAANGAQTEMVTTHAEIQHDVRTPTAYLQVNTDAGSLTVSIPPIYVTNGKLGPQVRIDIYSCQGPLTVPMGQVDVSQYGYDYGNDLDNPSLSKYSANVANISGMMMWSSGYIYGGADAMSFEQLRARTIYRYTKGQTPITPDQATIASSEAGYKLTLARDDLTTRIYYASRQAPVDPSGQFSTPIPSGICTVQVNMAAMAGLPGVFDNQLRVTFSPKTLFAISNGVTSPMDASQYPNASGDSLLTAVNAKDYVYTPFYYVMDANDANFDLRAYYLEDTQVKSRQFLGENPSTQLSLRSGAIQITRTELGWEIVLAVTPSANYATLDPNDVYCQIGYIPPGETVYAFMNGELMGADASGVWYWKWVLEGTYDFDSDDNIAIKGWSILDTTIRDLKMALTTDFIVVHTVANYTVPGLTASDFESSIGRQLLPDNAVGVQLESMTLQLGIPLDSLWRGARTVTGSQTFETYDQDVYAYADKDEPKVDPVSGLPVYSIVDGEIVYEYEYRKGDPILNPDGTQAIAHYKGTVKYLNGNPVVSTPRTVGRIIDVFMMSGLYYYANDTASTTEATYLPQAMCSQYLPDMATLLGKPMEQTKLYFYPQRSLGSINIIANNNESLMVDSQVSIAGTVYLSDAAYTSASYRQSVQRIITNVITAKLQEETVSMLDINSTLANNLDAQVKGVALTLTIDGEVMNTFSAGNGSARTGIRRVLKVNEDGKYGVAQDVQLEWSTHVPPSDALYTKVIGGRTYTSN